MKMKSVNSTVFLLIVHQNPWYLKTSHTDSKNSLFGNCQYLLQLVVVSLKDVNEHKASSSIT